MRISRHALSAAGGVLIVAAIAAPSSAKVSRAHAAAAGCAPAGNIEAIIDDSGSMAATDPNTLRVKGLKLLIDALSRGTTLGAVEFGSSFDPATEPSADTVFPAEPVGPNAAAMGAALDAVVLADNGGTDYNAAFAQSDAANPDAQARIFLTDGGHNEGDYANGHLTHTVPTYVIGFSTAALDPGAAARLQAIADDTGGHYYAQTDSSQLQSVMNDIAAALTCQQPPKTFTDQLAQGASKSHRVAIAAGTKSVRIALTWASPLDAFTLSHLKLVRHGRKIAVAARRHHRPRKLRVKTTSSPTFTVLRVSHLKKGRLKFKVKAKTIGSGLPQVTLTTQVSGRAQH